MNGVMFSAQHIHRALASYESLEVMADAYGCGPVDGCCLVAAKALLLAWDELELVRIESSANGGQVEHFGVIHPEGQIIDGDGVYAHPDEWVSAIRDDSGEDYSFERGFPARDLREEEAIDDATMSKRLSAIYLKVLSHCPCRGE